MESSASLSLPKNTNSFPSEPSVIPFLHHKSSVDTIVTKPTAVRTQLANGYVDVVSNAESVPSVQQSSQHSHVTVGLMHTPNLSSNPCVGPNIVLHPTVMPLASTGSQATSFEGLVQSINDCAHPVQFEGPVQSTNDHAHPVQFDDVNSGPFQSEFDSTDGDRSMPGPDQISTVITERIDDQISRAITERFDAPSSSVQSTDGDRPISGPDQISSVITERIDAPTSSVQSSSSVPHSMVTRAKSDFGKTPARMMPHDPCRGLGALQYAQILDILFNSNQDEVMFGLSDPP
ncbi:hypothetical protein NE237_030806 [Protea cynaroides]|uniref:Uncharacterized protein n=1 Tax=Protea cynaroides TaxID=273540 RepID=A0A9Q0JV81_9MAGN|nr:hypothetical protein NE237_030806 [Protea cynaroides]